MIVVDASLIIELSLATPSGREIQKRLRDATDLLAAPELIDLEVLQVLRRIGQRDPVHRENVELAYGIFVDLPIDRFTHAPLRERIWALRNNLTPPCQ